MAMAHAIDQFKPKHTNFMPMVAKTTNMGGWSKNKNQPKSINRRTSGGRYVRF